jgi:5-methylcytosine-specific restriction enzyme subunit McrC
MRKRLNIQTREFGHVPIPAGPLAARIERRLLRTTSDLPFNVFTVDRRGLRADAVVGVFDIGDVAVEILPKVEAGSTPEQDRAFLIDLLLFSEVVPRLVIRRGSVALGNDPLLEVLIRAAALEVAGLLRRGLPRRYSLRRENSPVIRGQIEFARLARRPPWDHQSLPIRYAPLQRNNPLGQIVRALVAILESSSKSARTISILRDCSTMLADVQLVPLTRGLIEQVQLSRFEEEWRPVLELASSLVAGKVPTPVTSGTTMQFTLLFPLSDLFERAIRRALRAELDQYDLVLEELVKNPRLLRRADSTEVISLRPDLLVARSGTREPVLVADAKWKKLERGRAYGVQPADVYQIATYMTRHQVAKGVLIFPMTDWMRHEVIGPTWTADFTFSGSDASLRLVGVDIAKLVSRVASEQLESRAALATAVILTGGS